MHSKKANLQNAEDCMPKEALEVEILLTHSSVKNVMMCRGCSGALGP